MTYTQTSQPYPNFVPDHTYAFAPMISRNMSATSNEPAIVFTITLEPTSESYPFEAKSLKLREDIPVMLGSYYHGRQVRDHTPDPTNGMFAPHRIADCDEDDAAASLALSDRHAEVWWNGESVFIRDLDSAFGTYVNEKIIQSEAVLRNGDIVRLGRVIPRNERTPENINDYQLKAITFIVGIVGASTDTR